MGRKVTVAACTLNQWALDFEGNLERILESVQEAKELGALYRTGPELEICGYSCEDHFHEPDTFLHSWEVLAELLKSATCQDILMDVGMPVLHKNVAYNCRVVFLNTKILLIRPKLIMCENGNYRESRWFSNWTKEHETEEFYLPRMITTITEQLTVPIGDAVIATRDTCIGFEICEELWNADSRHIPLALDGVEIISNGSASYMELRKAHVTADLINSATFKSGGAYLFSNLRGCDGQRLYFNGSTCVSVNGHIVARGRQFDVKDIEVVTATIDLEDIRAYKMNMRSRSHRAAQAVRFPRISVDFSLSDDSFYGTISKPLEITFPTPMEEICLGPACWLWDYLRRAGAGGFFLPLSGGVDSASCATIVFSMCNLLYEAIAQGDSRTLSDLRRVAGSEDFTPRSALDVTNKLLVTCYMATTNSSQQTKQSALDLSSKINSYHMSVTIDTAVSAVVGIFSTFCGLVPKFRTHGGSVRENLAMQNVQARVRMVVSYLFAQLSLWSRGRAGALLVLGSSNVDEALRGYMTKYDCSSADLNPIGGISKADLKDFLHYASKRFDLQCLESIVRAPPTAELEPLSEGQIVQTDEQDMGMTYDELSQFGALRKCQHCGPYSMFHKLLHTWSDHYTPAEVASKVKLFFRSYAVNRHKMSVLTPAVHAEGYSPDDHRYDHRQLLYRADWSWQFAAIDRDVSLIDPSKMPNVKMM